MGLRDIEATLPPGFRFAPSDEELVCHYLYEKIADKKPSNSKDAMVEVNLHLCEPWQLPDVAKVGANEWYFFSFRDRKYSTGFRSNRSTTSGYWKATGKDRAVLDPRTGLVVGMRKTLVFYNGRAPNGVKSGWVMHEFRLENAHMPPKEDWVLCRVFNKCKEDLTTSVVMHNGFNPTLLVSSPTFSSSSPVPPANMPCGFQQRTPFVQIQNYEDKDPRILLDVSAFQNPLSTMHSGHPDCQGTCAPMGEIQSSGDGILLDLVFDDKVIEDAESLDFDELVF